jgi:hypothetical protein
MRKLFLATIATVALGSAALAQSRTYQPLQPPPQPFPAPKQQGVLAGAPPRADFPGPRQSENNGNTKTHRSTSKLTSKRHAQHMYGKHHHAS